MPMRCSKCRTNNPPDNKFCGQCGNALRTLCAKCGAENPPVSNFCGQCGAQLKPAEPPQAIKSEQIQTQAPSVEAPYGERRHLTVLFCDLVGSTGIAARLDPEDWREIVDSYHRAATEAITKFGGHVAQYLGDGGDGLLWLAGSA
jgi:ribosomal protein L40E